MGHELLRRFPQREWRLACDRTLPDANARCEPGMLIEGSCHCANLSFTLDWSPSPLEIPARACGCSFCMKHGGVWTSKRDGSLRIRVGETALVSRYAFETQSADFLICRRCGVVPVVISAIEGRTYAVVNVHTFDNVSATMLQQSPISFAAENPADRLARRQANWIAEVQFNQPLS